MTWPYDDGEDDNEPYECDECAGTGDCSYCYGDDAECDNCHGAGPCPICHGEGVVD